MSKVPNLSDNILEFCEKRGYLKSLDKSLDIPESKRFDKQNINKKGLDILDAIHCVLDKNRTDSFLKEISSTIKKDDLILEAGVGTGILSYAAALQGAHVHGIEINRSNLELARNIRKYLRGNSNRYKKHMDFNPIFHYQDALEYKTRNKFDCIISENIYTGMFYEKQVQIMNHLIQFLKPDGKVIPSKMNSHISLCELKGENRLRSDFFLIVVDDLRDKRQSYKILSPRKIYSSIDFSKKNIDKISYTEEVRVNQSGTINSIYLTSDIYFPSGGRIKGSNTTFFGNDIILPIKKSLKVEAGDLIKISMSYSYGDNPKNIDISINKQLGQ